MEAKLKPCPKCGSEMVWRWKQGISAVLNGSTYTLTALARCPSCGATFVGMRTRSVGSAGSMCGRAAGGALGAASA